MTYPGTLRDRFDRVEAIDDLVAVTESDFPPELRGDWHRLIGALYPTDRKLRAIRTRSSPVSSSPSAGAGGGRALLTVDSTTLRRIITPPMPRRRPSSVRSGSAPCST